VVADVMELGVAVVGFFEAKTAQTPQPAE
jgi:hypothetical protein